MSVLMHRVIFGLEHGDKREVDHIGPSKIDNRRSNIRIVTHQQNMQNRRKQKGTSSKFRGVHKRKGKITKPWQAYGSIPGAMKTKHIGFFETEEEAGAAALAWRQEHQPFAVD